MRRYIVAMTIVVTVLVTMLGLGIVNYYTCFAYYLPHRSAIIEIAPQDILVEVHPQWIAIPGGFNQTAVSVNWARGLPANSTTITLK